MPTTRQLDSVVEPLGEYQRRIWPANPGAYGSRLARRGGPYDVFIPSPIAKRAFSLGDDAVAAVSGATKALAHLKSMTPRMASLEALARNIMRSESVASSRIEGIEISHKRLARAAYQGTDSRAGDSRAAEVLGNVDAIERAVEIGAASAKIAVADVQDIHRVLLRFTGDTEIAGVLRTQQNWIGGNDYNPVGADYVPPPHELVRGQLDDLCRFIRREDIAPIAQAAIAHAQFEHIHPFADGNGRTGRALIYTTLRRRGEIGGFVPPISLVLARESKAYISGLGEYRAGRVDIWCERFANAAALAAQEAGQIADAIEDCEARWVVRLGTPRQDSAVRQLIRELPAYPVIDVAAGQRLTGKSHVSVGKALQQLEAVGIIQPLNEKKWGRAWECGELLDLVTELEARLSTP